MLADTVSFGIARAPGLDWPDNRWRARRHKSPAQQAPGEVSAEVFPINSVLRHFPAIPPPGSQHALGLYARAVHLACCTCIFDSVDLSTGPCTIFCGLASTVFILFYFCRVPSVGAIPDRGHIGKSRNPEIQRSGPSGPGHPGRGQLMKFERGCPRPQKRKNRILQIVGGVSEITP